MNDKRLNNHREVIIKILSKARDGYSINQMMDMVQEDSMNVMKGELNALIGRGHVRMEHRNHCRECAREYSTYHLSDIGRIYLHHIKYIPTMEEVWGYDKKPKGKK